MSTEITDAHALALEHAGRVAAEAQQLRDENARLRAALERIATHQVDTSEFWAKRDALYAETNDCAGCQQARERQWPPSRLCDHHYSRITAVTEARERHEQYRRWADLREIARAALTPTPEPSHD